MGYQSDRQAAQQDRVRRTSTYQQLARNRKGQPPADLKHEQDAYRARFKAKKQEARTFTITDEDGNYPDTHHPVASERSASPTHRR